MNDSTRTTIFAAVAAVLAASAFGMHLATQPASLDEYSDVGQEFYPEFTQPRDATGLRVAAYNDTAARVDVFNVELQEGLWRIPSHHNYPADGEERLAKTATSIVGLQREALVSTSADDHKRLGVLDPLDESVTGTAGRGDRITLTKGEQTLADYIVGSRIEDGPPNTYNVRRADEDRTYRVTLNVDISTKFADWIEPDLLDFRRGDIRRMVVDRYSVDETRGVLVQGDVSELNRNSQDDPWKLTDIDTAASKVKVSTVNQMINALEDLAIVGVRPKPAGLSADLKRGSIIAEDGSVSMTALRDLQSRGFFLLPDGSLKSNEGEVTLALADGVKYVLGFGEVFTGSDVEIEVGQSSDKASDDAAGDAGTETAASEDAEANEGAESAAAGEAADATDLPDEQRKQSRYLFILTQFDETAMEPLPEAPTKPEPPKAEAPKDTPKDAPAEDTAADDAAKPADDSPADDAKPEDDAKPADDAQAEADTDPPADPSAEKQTDAEADAYKKALEAYEVELKEWERLKGEREQKIADGKKRAEQLNARFADWYYVISAEKFDDIRVKPEDLVEPVEPATDGDAPAANPALNDKPAASPAADAPAEAKPATDAPSDEPKAESSDAPSSDKPADSPSAAETAKPESPSPESPKPESSAPDGKAADTPAENPGS